MPCKVLNTGAYLDNRVKAGLITRENADLIYEFCEERKAMKHTTGATSLVISKYLMQSGNGSHPMKDVQRRIYSKRSMLRIPGLPENGLLRQAAPFLPDRFLNSLLFFFHEQ
jgi:hypothetical protein